MAAVSPTVPTAAVEHPLRNSNYRKLLIGGTISLLGDQFYLVALPWLVLQQTGSAAAMGTILMAGAIPRAVLMLMGGALTDRVSPRKIMMSTALARTVCVTVIGLLVWFQRVQTWELYALSVAFGIADAFAAPAAQAFLPFLLKREQLVAASSVSQSTAQLTTIMGPTPAGFVIKALGLSWAFFIDAISFLFVIGALLQLPDPPLAQAAKTAVWRSIMEGIGYVLKDVPLRSLMLLAAGMNFCVAGPITIGLAYVTNTTFGSAAALGIALSAVAAGSLGGALLAGIWKVRKRGLLILSVSVILAACLGAIGFLDRLWMIAAVLLVMGASAGLANVNIGAWIMQRIDVTVRGRVSSVLMLASVGLTPVSLAMAGWLIAWNVKSMFLLAAGLMLTVTLVAAVQKSMREIK
jgi:MFS family permease